MEQSTERYNNNLLQYINPGAHGKARQAFQAHGGIPAQELYKTVMCQTWLETASCGFGANCKFAHGEEELRPCIFPPPSVNLRKFKTRLCDKYTKRGICPYGSRCFFIHPEPTANPMVDNASYQQQLLSDSSTSLVTTSTTTSETRSEKAAHYNVPTPLFIPPPQPLPAYYYPVVTSPAISQHLEAACLEIIAARQQHPPQHQQSQLPRMESCPELALRSIWSPSEEEDIFVASSSLTENAKDGILSGGASTTVSASTSNTSSAKGHGAEVVEHKRCESAFNDSFGCFKEFHETLASSLANLLDISDTRF